MAQKAQAQCPETLPARWYWDEAIFARERAMIFARSWTLLAREEQCLKAGDYVSGDVAGSPVFVIRDENGELRGYHNVCRHRAGPILRDGTGHCNLRYGLRCQYHGWTYDVKGRLEKAPGFAEAPGFDRGQFRLAPLRVETWNGLVFVCLDEQTVDLKTWLGDIAGIADRFAPISELAFYGEAVQEGGTNWKTYCDNTAEGYHLPFVHPGLQRAALDFTVAPYETGQFVGFDVTYRTVMNYASGHSSEEGRPSRGFWIYKFPLLLLHFSEFGFNLERIIPLGPRRLRLVRWFWFPAGEGQEKASPVLEAGRLVMQEDLGMCEAVQRNLEAGVYETGRLSPLAEPGTIFLQRLVRQALG
jgi:choline monooxygenase